MGKKNQEKQLLPSNKVARMRVLASTAALNIFSSKRGRFQKVQMDLRQIWHKLDYNSLQDMWSYPVIVGITGNGIDIILNHKLNIVRFWERKDSDTLCVLKAQQTFRKEFHLNFPHSSGDRQQCVWYFSEGCVERFIYLQFTTTGLVVW